MNYANNRTRAGGIVLMIALVCVVASPFSVSFSAHDTLQLTVAEAAGCPLGSQQVGTNADGTPQCQVAPGGVVFSGGAISCEGLSFLSNFFHCFGRAAGAFVAGSLVFITSTLLTISGMLFDWLVNNTIVRFGEAVYTEGVRAAVETAWTAFRDIANILIIGIFTFIAISIILGLKEFGQKKLIANVLIIAVLINFSLLFTKMIIDASNFTARQIYTASTGQTISASSNTGETQSYDIAGAFLRYAGVSGFSDTFSATRQLADNLDNGFIALLHGVFTAALLLGAAFVLFYGSFLLVSRTVLIIFLMITASVAFASYLVPKWASSSYGWSTWWSSLIKSAALAPILMFFLWATLTVAAALKQSGGTLGDLATNPTKTADISALFNYIIVLGLLFVSFKLSSTFAGKIAGFNFASLGPALAVGVGARFAGILGRQTIGRAGLALSDRMQAASRDRKRSDMARSLYDFGAQRFKSVAKRDFNAMRTPLGSSIQQTARIKKLDTLAGKEVKGFLGSQEAAADKIAEKARRMTPDDGQQKKIIAGAIAEQLQRDPVLGENHKGASEAERQFKQQQKQEADTLGALHEQHAKEMRNLHATLQEARSGGSQPAIQRAEQDILTAKQRQVTAIDEQTLKIRNANLRTEMARRSRESYENEAQERARATGKLERDGFTSAKETAKKLARNRLTSVLFSDAENERLANMAALEVGVQTGKRNLKDSGLLDAFKDQLGGGAGRAGHAPTTQPPPTATSGEGPGNS